MGAEPSFALPSSQGLGDEPEFTLDSHETIVTRGRVRAGWGRRTPLGQLVVTDRRLLLLRHRLFGSDRILEILRADVLAVSPPDAGGLVDVRYAARGDRQAVVRLGPLGWDAGELYRALSADA